MFWLWDFLHENLQLINSKYEVLNHLFSGSIFFGGVTVLGRFILSGVILKSFFVVQPWWLTFPFSFMGLKFSRKRLNEVYSMCLSFIIDAFTTKMLGYLLLKKYNYEFISKSTTKLSRFDGNATIVIILLKSLNCLAKLWPIVVFRKHIRN